MLVEQGWEPAAAQDSWSFTPLRRDAARWVPAGEARVLASDTLYSAVKGSTRSRVHWHPGSLDFALVSRIFDGSPPDGLALTLHFGRIPSASEPYASPIIAGAYHESGTAGLALLGRDPLFADQWWVARMPGTAGAGFDVLHLRLGDEGVEQARKQPRTQR